MIENQIALHRWYEALPGSLLKAQEVEVLSELLPTLFGYHLLKVGMCEDNQALSASKIPHQMVMDWSIGQPKKEGIGTLPTKLRGASHALPFEADSLDVIILHHALEFSKDPHQILREADRCLVPEGHVVVMGFNPVGPWALWHLLMGWREEPPWCGRFIRPARLRDWLQLLGFDEVETHHYFYRPPLKSAAMMGKLRILERLGSHWCTRFSAAYVMVAKKRVATLTPLKPRWRARRRRVVAPGLASNSSMKEIASEGQ